LGKHHTIEARKKRSQTYWRQLRIANEEAGQLSLTNFRVSCPTIQKLMSGTMDQSVIDALTGAGIAPESITKITGLLKMETGWDDAVKQFQESGKLLQGGLLEQALLQYGGSAGQTAVSRYGQGFNFQGFSLRGEIKRRAVRDVPIAPLFDAAKKAKFSLYCSFHRVLPHLEYLRVYRQSITRSTTNCTNDFPPEKGWVAHTCSGQG
jgi:hypothetical protein